jgi:hypothetical protein
MASVLWLSGDHGSHAGISDSVDYLRALIRTVGAFYGYSASCGSLARRNLLPGDFLGKWVTHLIFDPGHVRIDSSHPYAFYVEKELVGNESAIVVLPA